VRRHLARTIWRCSGNIEAIARTYDVQHCTVRRWVERLALESYLEETRATRRPDLLRRHWWVSAETKAARDARIAAIRASRGLPPKPSRKTR
jgi:hypothetical protein